MALPVLRHGAHAGLMGTPALSTLLGETWFGASMSADTRARLSALGRLVDLLEGFAVVGSRARTRRPSKPTWRRFRRASLACRVPTPLAGSNSTSGATTPASAVPRTSST